MNRILLSIVVVLSVAVSSLVASADGLLRCSVIASKSVRPPRKVPASRYSRPAPHEKAMAIGL